MAITMEDLRPGAEFWFGDTMKITPIQTRVVVKWVSVDTDQVHYWKEGTATGDIRETSIGRFVGIVSKGN